ncbi:hypothetical protein K2P97_09355 [bacterium]|nr:hypothetical protein [bacterium]
MSDNQVLNEIQKMNFKSVAWVYLKKNGNYENQISTNRDEILWVPSKGSAAVAKKTKFGDGVDRKRVIMVSLDNELLGLYDVMSPILATENVKLKIYLDLKNQACRLPKGNPAGTSLSKDELINLFETKPESK